jgi:hypothetical protein
MLTVICVILNDYASFVIIVGAWVRYPARLAGIQHFALQHGVPMIRQKLTFSADLRRIPKGL